MERYPYNETVYDGWVDDPGHPDYLHFQKNINELTTLSTFKACEVKLDSFVARKMSAKKVHEISSLLAYFDHNQISFNSVLDIGGGAGHLSSALCSHYPSLQSIVYDMNEEFMQQAQHKINKWLPRLREKISFKKVEVDSPITDGEADLLVGLHSCGDLSVHILKSHTPQLLNIGCCYHKLTKPHLNLSKRARLDLSVEARTLAAKNKPQLSEQEIKMRNNLKPYRYSTHFFLQDHKTKDYISLGNTHRDDFDKSFSEFYFKYVHQKYHDSSEVLEDYFLSRSNQKNIQYAMALDEIRNQLARVIELYIILDRALYLEEQGRKVKLMALFDERISPRNLAIFGS